MKKLSFDTWLTQTQKKKVIAFLSDYVYQKGLSENLTKDMIRHRLSQYGLLRKAEEQINNVRSLKNIYKKDFWKYGSWVGGGR
jgi:hypothetical protein